MMFPSLSTIVSLVVIYGMLLAIVRRPRTAAGLLAYILGFVLLSSYIKQSYLGMAITLADLHFFLLRPVENFKLFVAYPALGATLIAVLVGLALGVMAGRRWEPPLGTLCEPRTGSGRRAAIAAFSIVLGVGAALAAGLDSRERADNNDAWAAFQTMYEQQNPGGPVGRINVFFGNRTFAADLPPARAQRRFNDSAQAADMNRAHPGSRSGDVLPDIMLVLEESTLDTRLFKDCLSTACDHAMFHPQRNAARTLAGPLLVHTTGGGTWLAEFAVVAGLDWRVFGRGGAFAPVSLAPRLKRSLPEHLRSLGYRTIAIYPTDGNFLSAETAYDHYGFDEFYDRKELQLADDWYQVRDGLVFEKAQALALRQDNRPIFMFVLTIRNHGPHGTRPEDIPPDFRAVERQTSTRIADLLKRTRDSSQDFVALADRWLAAPTARVLVWFGDHQPEAAWEITAQFAKLDPTRWPQGISPELSQYLTYFQMSANFGGQTEAAVANVTDLSYLGALLLDFAGLPLDASDRAALAVMQECRGLMIDCADRELIGDYLSYRIHELRNLE